MYRLFVLNIYINMNINMLGIRLGVYSCLRVSKILYRALTTADRYSLANQVPLFNLIVN